MEFCNGFFENVGKNGEADEKTGIAMDKLWLLRNNFHTPEERSNENNMENKFARFLRNTGPARFFLPMGVMLIVFGILMLVFMGGGEYLETVGRVTAVTEELNMERQKEYDVSFTYTVDGKEYTGTFDNVGSGYSQGDEIKVFYDAENPNSISNTKLGGLIAPVLIGLGVLALVFGVLKTVKAFQKSKALDGDQWGPRLEISLWSTATRGFESHPLRHNQRDAFGRLFDCGIGICAGGIRKGRQRSRHEQSGGRRRRSLRMAQKSRFRKCRAFFGCAPGLLLSPRDPLHWACVRSPLSA